MLSSATALSFIVSCPQRREVAATALADFWLTAESVSCAFVQVYRQICPARLPFARQFGNQTSAGNPLPVDSRDFPQSNPPERDSDSHRSNPQYLFPYPNP